ncbi:MAG: hypothetical protein K2X81_24605, partial [Candidatus Obscuribacterales bacterium]|nr:hypothetical protein [Candidatus Obscuribacterales bacterium]
MADQAELNEGSNSVKGKLVDQLVHDNSRAFLDESRPAMAQTKVEAEASVWKAMGDRDNKAPSKLNSPEDLKSLQDKGWKVEKNDNYTYLTHDSADGKLKELDVYKNQGGVRLSQEFLSADSKEAMASSKYKRVDVGFKDDGSSPTYLNIKTADYGSTFEARFNKEGKLAEASESGRDKDHTSYSFREDGSLYEALTRSKKDSSVLNDQLFNSKGEPLSDFNPLYLYERAKRPVENLYMGIREIR